MIENLIKKHNIYTSDINIQYKRSLYTGINWNNKLIALVGSRGTGKTTLLLQYYKESFQSPEECLYIFGDDIEVVSLGLYKIAEEYYLNGGKVLIIDEVHKYPNWSQEIKNIYDMLPKLKVIISGSSTLNIIKQKYDLSRRVVTYKLLGLSFREFIQFNYGVELQSNTIEEIFKDHLKISRNIISKLNEKDLKVYSIFKKYLTYGYYPFYFEGEDTYLNKLNNNLNKILYEDLLTSFNVKSSSIPYLKRLIFIVASSSPFTVDVSAISRTVGISRDYVYEYIDYLIEAEIFTGIKGGITSKSITRKPLKLLLANPNLYELLGKTYNLLQDTGSLRESFAFNQISSIGNVTMPEKGDILVNNKYLIEIGGKDKNFDQIKGINDAYVFADGIEIGYKNKIPLWLLGFLY